MANYNYRGNIRFKQGGGTHFSIHLVLNIKI